MIEATAESLGVGIRVEQVSYQIQQFIFPEIIPGRLIFGVYLRNRDRCRKTVQEAQCILTIHR